MYRYIDRNILPILICYWYIFTWTTFTQSKLQESQLKEPRDIDKTFGRVLFSANSIAKSNRASPNPIPLYNQIEIYIRDIYIDIQKERWIVR